MVLSLLDSISAWSRPISPNSLTTTAQSASAGSRSRRLSSVVLPLPRKPVISDTGSRCSGYMQRGYQVGSRQCTPQDRILIGENTGNCLTHISFSGIISIAPI